MKYWLVECGVDLLLLVGKSRCFKSFALLCKLGNVALVLIHPRGKVSGSVHVSGTSQQSDISNLDRTRHSVVECASSKLAF